MLGGFFRNAGQQTYAVGSLALALACRDEEATVLCVVHVQKHRRAEHGLRLGALAPFEQRRT